MTAHVLHQRMRGDTLIEPPLAPALIKLEVADAQIFEGDTISFTAKRSVNSASICSCKWSAVAANPADLTGTVSGTLNFGSGATSIVKSVTTVNRSGAQGDRDVVISLSEPNSCTIDPVTDHMTVTLQDVIIEEPPPPPPGRQDLPFNGQFVGVPEMHMQVGEYNIGRGNHECIYRMVSRRNKPILRIVWDIRITQTDHIPGVPGSDNQPYRYSSGDGGRIIIEVRRAKPGTENSPTKCWPDMSTDGLLGQTNINNNPPYTRDIQPKTPGTDYGTGFGRKTNDQKPSYDLYTESEKDGGNTEEWKFINPIPAMAVGTIFFIRWYNVHPNKADNDCAVNTHQNAPYNSVVNPMSFDRRGPYHGWKDQVYDSTDGCKTLKFYKYGTMVNGFVLIHGEPGDLTTASITQPKNRIAMIAGGSGNYNEFLRNISKSIWIRWWITNMPFDMDADRWGMCLFNCACTQFNLTLREDAGSGYNDIYNDNAMDVKNLHKDSDTFGTKPPEKPTDPVPDPIPWEYWKVKGQPVVKFKTGFDYQTILKVQTGSSAQIREVNRPARYPSIVPRDIFTTLKCHFTTNGTSWTELSGLRYFPGCWIAPEVDIWTP